MQARYQYGTLTLRKRKRGPHVWQWRYVENGRRKSIIMGTLEKLPTKADALRVLEVHRLRINSENPQTKLHALTVGTIIDRYLTEEMPVAGCLGLRISEISGLQWGDIDWDRLTLSVQRSVVSGRVYQTKTEASQKPLPLDPDLAEILFRFRGRAVYVAPSDFIFAGNSGRPRWPGIMLTDHIKPAGQRAGIGKIGWHTFRHTFSSILHDAGT